MAVFIKRFVFGGKCAQQGCTVIKVANQAFRKKRSFHINYRVVGVLANPQYPILCGTQLLEKECSKTLPVGRVLLVTSINIMKSFGR